MHPLVVALGLALPAAPFPMFAHAPTGSVPRAASPSPRAPAVEPTQVVVELAERGLGAVRRISRYEIGLLSDGSPSRLESNEGPLHTRFTVRRQPSEGGHSSVSLEVERERRGERGQPNERTSFSMQANVAHGKRVVLGKVVKPDGTGMEVTVALR